MQNITQYFFILLFFLISDQLKCMEHNNLSEEAKAFSIDVISAQEMDDTPSQKHAKKKAIISMG